MQELDTNKDGKISFDEFLSGIEIDVMPNRLDEYIGLYKAEVGV